MLCNWVATAITVVARLVRARMASWACHDVGDHLGQGPVVPDGAGQNIRNLLFPQGVHDAVVDESAGHGCGYGARPAHHVQGVQVVVMPQVDRPLGRKSPGPGRSE